MLVLLHDKWIPLGLGHRHRDDHLLEDSVLLGQGGVLLALEGVAVLGLAANAVALPAGRIILFRGLVEKIGSEEALAMVIAHELGHYAHRDHLRGLGRGLVLMAIGIMLGADANAPGIIMPSIETLDLKFSRRQEQAADYFAIEAVFKAYGKVGEGLKLYDILDEAEPQGFRFVLFSTHPDTLQRKDNLVILIASRQYPKGPATLLPGDGRLPFSAERRKPIKP